jgi:hypothetical protein
MLIFHNQYRGLSVGRSRLSEAGDYIGSCAIYGSGARQQDLKGRAVSKFTDHTDRPIQTTDDAMDHGQSEAATRRFSGKERVEYP